MTRVVLIRHGQTEWNREERFRGRADLDLTPLGVQQAEAMAQRLKSWDIAAIYSSPLLRAMRTAQPLGTALGLQVQTLEGLIDIDYGEWQGLSLAEAEARDEVMYRQWLEHPELVHFPGGESLEQVQARAAAAVQEMAASHPDQTVTLVSHKVVCKVLVCHALGLDNSHFWRVDQDLCAINVFELTDGQMRASLINDCCHLTGLASPDFKP